MGKLKGLKRAIILIFLLLLVGYFSFYVGAIDRAEEVLPLTKELARKALESPEITNNLDCGLAVYLPGYSLSYPRYKTVSFRLAQEYWVGDQLIRPRKYVAMISYEQGRKYTFLELGVKEKDVWELCRLVEQSPLIQWVPTKEEGMKLKKDFVKRVSQLTSQGKTLYTIGISLRFTREHGNTIRLPDGEVVAVAYTIGSDLISQREMEEGKGKPVYEYVRKYLDKVKEAKHSYEEPGPLKIDRE